MDWEVYSFVMRGSLRRKVIGSLDRPRTPTEIGRAQGISLHHVSRTLKELGEKGMVICLTPKATSGRVYNLTEKGKKIQTLLKD